MSEKPEHLCTGQSEDYCVIYQEYGPENDRKGEWLVLDVGAQHVIPIKFCPYCGWEFDN